MIINKSNIETYLLGASVYACGGGIPSDKAKEMFGDSEIQVKPIEEFKADDYLMSVYGIGSVSDTKQDVDFSALAKDAIIKLEDLTQSKCKGLIPGEIGGEMAAFVVASKLGLPVLDSDLVGGRAAPEVTMDAYTINYFPVSPAILVLANGKSYELAEPLPGSRVENWSRNILSKEKSPGVLAGYAKPICVLQNILTPGTISTTMKRGQNMSIRQLDKKEIVTNGKVVKVKLKDDEGFLTGYVELDNGIRLILKNEILGILEDNKLIKNAPDIICAFCDDKPLHSTNIKQGQNITVISLKPIEQWGSLVAQGILGKEYVQKLIYSLQI